MMIRTIKKVGEFDRMIGIRRSVHGDVVNFYTLLYILGK